MAPALEDESESKLEQALVKSGCPCLRRVAQDHACWRSQSGAVEPNYIGPVQDSG